MALAHRLALLLLGFAFLLQGIWVALTRNFDMTPFDRAKMTAAVGFAARDGLVGVDLAASDGPRWVKPRPPPEALLPCSSTRR